MMATNYANIIESAKKMYKSSSKERKAFNEEYYSLSRLLKDMQTKTLKSVAEPIFSMLGLTWTADKKSSDYITAPIFLSLLRPEQQEVDKKGETHYLVWSRTQKTEKDKDGNRVKVWADAEKTVPVMESKTTRIREGKWTLNLLVKVCAQLAAFETAARESAKAAKEEKAA